MPQMCIRPALENYSRQNCFNVSPHINSEIRNFVPSIRPEQGRWQFGFGFLNPVIDPVLVGSNGRQQVVGLLERLELCFKDRFRPNDMFLHQGHEGLGPRFAAAAANGIESVSGGLINVEIDKNFLIFIVF